MPQRRREFGACNARNGRTTVSHAAIENEQIGRRKLRAPAVTGAKPSLALPGIPTLGEFVPGYEATAFNGVGAPKHTPAGIIDTLNNAINAGLADPKVQERLTMLGSSPAPMSPNEFGKLIVEETERWGKVFKAAGIKAE